MRRRSGHREPGHGEPSAPARGDLAGVTGQPTRPRRGATLMTNEPIHRRNALRCMVLAGATAAAPQVLRARASATAELSLTVLLDEAIGTIRPAIYSQFA